MIPHSLLKLRVYYHIILGGYSMAKRKAEFNAVEKYTKTPHKNVQDNEFSAEFTDNNNAIRFQNRNSKQGKKGRS
jgi:hypothetical protein